METVECIVVTKEWFSSLDQARPTFKILLLQEMTREISARLRQANLEISALQRA